MIEVDPLDIFMERLTPEVRAMVQQIRLLIKEVIPAASEKVHLGWNVIHYRPTGGKMRDVVVAIDPQRTYVNLEFGDGVELPDPARRLTGTGKRLRHVKIRDSNDVQDIHVRTLLEEAARRRERDAGPLAGAEARDRDTNETDKVASSLAV